mmetsp:Transcript_10350/g.31152  ORF Transcript_10350/g.31152 Transcript_10350/m.31152 type:complete len:465 (+) Transcript_10350:485-1879(+)
MTPKDVAWLRDGIAQALGWDTVVAEGVAQAISGAGSPKEVEEIVGDYCGGHADVAALVREFQRDTQGVAAATVFRRPVRQHVRQAGSVSGFARTTQQRVGNLGAPAGHEDGGPEVVDGLRVKRSSRKGKAGEMGAAGAPKPALERSVCNCLACGKVYDCRSTFSTDTVAFIEAGGVCTYCGYKVSLNHRNRSETREACSATAAGALREEDPSDTASLPGVAAGDTAADVPAHAVVDDAEAAAVAFKNRLVEADRNSAQRTTVVDDQSDFFEIDGNAWLSEEERRSLRERQRAIEEAEAAKRKRVVLSFDMLGRQVLLTDDAGDDAEVAAGGCSAAAADVAAAATAEEIPQGGGTAARAAASLADSLRITPNPSLAVHPMFVRPRPKSDRASAGKRPDGSSQKTEGVPSLAKHPARPGKGGEEGGTSKVDTGGSCAAHHRRTDRRRLPRLQHDDMSAAVIAPADR